MRKFTILLCLVFVLSVSVFAAQPKIVDDADLLSQSEMTALENKAASIVSSYDMDVVIVTVDTLGGRSAQGYADDYFDDNGYGIGSEYSGILLLLSTGEREWAVSTCGDAIDAIRNSEIDGIMDDILDDLSAGYYYDAFDSFLSHVDKQYKAHLSGTDPDAFKYILIALAIGAAVAGIALLVMRGKMNTAKQQRGAISYLCDGSYDLYRCHDFYLYSRTSRTRKAETSSGSHRSSSGRSHGGRSGRF